MLLVAAAKMRFKKNGGTETNCPKGKKAVLKIALRHIYIYMYIYILYIYMRCRVKTGPRFGRL